MFFYWSISWLWLFLLNLILKRKFYFIIKDFINLCSLILLSLMILLNLMRIISSWTKFDFFWKYANLIIINSHIFKSPIFLFSNFSFIILRRIWFFPNNDFLCDIWREHSSSLCGRSCSILTFLTSPYYLENIINFCIIAGLFQNIKQFLFNWKAFIISCHCFWRRIRYMFTYISTIDIKIFKL